MFMYLYVGQDNSASTMAQGSQRLDTADLHNEKKVDLGEVWKQTPPSQQAESLVPGSAEIPRHRGAGSGEPAHVCSGAASEPGHEGKRMSSICRNKKVCRRGFSEGKENSSKASRILLRTGNSISSQRLFGCVVLCCKTLKRRLNIGSKHLTSRPLSKPPPQKAFLRPTPEVIWVLLLAFPWSGLSALYHVAHVTAHTRKTSCPVSPHRDVPCLPPASPVIPSPTHSPKGPALCTALSAHPCSPFHLGNTPSHDLAVSPLLHDSPICIPHAVFCLHSRCPQAWPTEHILITNSICPEETTLASVTSPTAWPGLASQAGSEAWKPFMCPLNNDFGGVLCPGSFIGTRNQNFNPYCFYSKKVPSY